MFRVYNIRRHSKKKKFSFPNSLETYGRASYSLLKIVFRHNNQCDNKQNNTKMAATKANFCIFHDYSQKKEKTIAIVRST